MPKGRKTPAVWPTAERAGTFDPLGSLLLATHVVLWWLTDAADLSDDLKQRIDHEPAVYLSPATAWEITVKQSIGKLIEPHDLPEIIIGAGFRHLPITAEHAATAGRLPLLHRDPFAACEHALRADE